MKLIYNGREYTDEITANAGNVELKHAMVGETLTIDTMSVPIIAEDKIERLIASDQGDMDFLLDVNGEILCSTEAERIPEFISNAPGMFYFNDGLVCKHYLTELNQVSYNEHKLTFYSAIKKLETDHEGGIYTGQTAETVIADIMGDVPYTVGDNIKPLSVYGYLPYAKRRSNLQFLLMALGVHIRNASDGTLEIKEMSTELTGYFGEDRVFIGGSVVDNAYATSVNVTEHNYIATGEEVTVYENTTFDTEKIIFNEPVFDLSITNGTISESGVNYCIFEGDGFVTITGKRYLHVQRVVSHGADKSIVKSVTNNTLINPFNATDVAERLYNLLSVKQTIKQEVLFGNERPGDLVRVIQPYKRTLVDACLKKMSISIGLSELRAVCEFLVGYKPSGIVEGFTEHYLLTESGTWTVPSGKTKVRIIMCGSGVGAYAGHDGEESSTSGAGQGGEGGLGGQGALILEMNLDVTPGATFSYSCADYGDGSISPELPGTENETTFGSYTTQTGRRYNYGYYEPRTGLVLGRDGSPGMTGGKGSSYEMPGNTIIYKGVTYYPGEDGNSITDPITALGGCGGGAAAGGDGYDGERAYWAYSGSNPAPVNGEGGYGADAATGDGAAEYGGGGQGGHGGGGGGQSMEYIFGGPGIGGSGGQGGQGGQGCIIIYV